LMPRNFVSEHRPEPMPMGLAELLSDLGEPEQVMGGPMGHSEQISSSITSETGADGKEHVFEVETRCIDGNCTKTKREVDSIDEPEAQMIGGELPIVDGELPMVGGDLPMVGGELPVFPGDLDQLFGQIFGGGMMAGPPEGFESLRLRLRPDKFNVAPLEHEKNEDGSEAILGDLPTGLNASTLLVEQRGHVVVIRYTLNQTFGSGEPVGVEQHVRLGFQPEKKEKARYDPAVGYFKMLFPRPKDSDFDPKVEIVFGSDDSQTKAPSDRAKEAKERRDAPITARIMKGKSSDGQEKKSSLMLEIGAEEL